MAHALTAAQNILNRVHARIHTECRADRMGWEETADITSAADVRDGCPAIFFQGGYSLEQRVADFVKTIAAARGRTVTVTAGAYTVPATRYYGAHTVRGTWITVH